MPNDRGGIGHNRQKKTVYLEPDLVEFAIENCEANLRLGMNTLQTVQEGDNLEFARKLVDLIEKFKSLKAAMEKAV